MFFILTDQNCAVFPIVILSSNAQFSSKFKQYYGKDNFSGPSSISGSIIIYIMSYIFNFQFNLIGTN